jgi:SAM-dependent methyltransferase
MGCIAYFDPRLAAVYDPLNPTGPYEAYYRDLAGTVPKTILDMGCGTGRLARAFAAVGHRVTGADPAPGMLAVARSRAGADAVTWIESDAAGLCVDARFDLIVMTGHAFQALIEDEDVRRALANLRRHLAPAGCLAFETRNPAMREWEDWVPEKTRERVAVPGIGTVEVHYDIRLVDGPLVTFETHFRFGPGDVVVAPHTLRFMTRAELAGFLAAAAFTEVAWYGDWDRSPVGPTSPELIVVAR